MKRRGFLMTMAAALAGSAALVTAGRGSAAGKFPFTLTDAEWKQRLSPAAYRVLREEDTERAGTSPLNNEKR